MLAVPSIFVTTLILLVARRRDRQRREARRAREHQDVHARDPMAFNGDAALLRWKQKLCSLTGRGFTAPPFAEPLRRRGDYVPRRAAEMLHVPSRRGDPSDDDQRPCCCNRLKAASAASRTMRRSVGPESFFNRAEADETCSSPSE